MADPCDKENPQGSFQINQIRDQLKITVFHIKSKRYRRIGASAFIVGTLVGSTNELSRIASESLQKAEADAQEAIRLDPNNIDAYLALGLARESRGEFVQAEDLFKQALSLDPGNPDALHGTAAYLRMLGD
jgi:tetratricopeptide (TPR) repeat protein